MCKEYEVAKKIVDEYVDSKSKFSFDDIYHEILKNGGVLAIANGTSVEDYLKYFVRQSKLKYDSWQRIYEKIV